MHEFTPTAEHRGGMELGVLWFDELEFAWWAQERREMVTLVRALTHVTAAPPLPPGVADPRLLEPVDQGAFERAAATAAGPRPGMSVLRSQRLAECVRALADCQSPQQVLAAARAREPYDGLVDVLHPFTQACVQVGRAVGRSEALRAIQWELE